VTFETTIEGPSRAKPLDDEDDDARLCFVLVWAAEEHERLGEIVIPEDGAVFGRGPLESEDDDEPRVGLARLEPRKRPAVVSLESPFLSRRQLKFSVPPSGDGVDIEVVGRKALRVADTEMRAATVREGDLFEIDGIYAFYCARRPVSLAEAPLDRRKRFGHADDHGIVGESPAAWSLRSAVDFAGGRNAHVLVTGASGTGKELVAQAIHRLSARAKKEIVSRNAATFPSGLIDAELFGNLANYPNVGMPERAGLIGQADGSTLFLDEIGELPSDLQAHLLRVLDSGEYQRLGDSRRRVADFRLIAATNRAADELKEDVAARLALRIQLPGLDERREDVPLLARHILQRTAARDPALAKRFFRADEPRLSVELARALVLHDYTTHVRELENLLLRSAASSRGDELELTKDAKKLVRFVARPAPREVGPEEIRAALARHGGVKDKAWRELGLPSRHALHRLLKKLDIPE
jgi:two-component system nitrogen regulation response regulator GlnG/two-component system response regulator HydG